MIILFASLILLLCRSVHSGCYGKYTAYNDKGFETSMYSHPESCQIFCQNSTCRFVRGDECICYSNLTGLTRVKDEYCHNGTGGNFAGSVSCSTLEVSLTEEPVLGTSPLDVKWSYVGESLLDCDLKKTELTLPFCDYFPDNISPSDCSALCSHLNATYAILGYSTVPRRFVNDASSVPVCLCTNEIYRDHTDEQPTFCPSTSFPCGYIGDGTRGSAYCVKSKCMNSERCGSNGCKFSEQCDGAGNCYVLSSVPFGDRYEDFCSLSGVGGDMLSLETREKQDYILDSFENDLETFGYPNILTSGYSTTCLHESFDWVLKNSDISIKVDETVPDAFEIANSEMLTTCYIWLVPTSSSWKGTAYVSGSSIYFICQHKEPIVTVSTTLSTDSTTQLPSTSLDSTSGITEVSTSEATSSSKSTPSTMDGFPTPTTPGLDWSTTTQDFSTTSPTTLTMSSTTTPTTESSTFFITDETTSSSSTSGASVSTTTTTITTPTTTSRTPAPGDCVCKAVGSDQYSPQTFEAIVNETKSFRCPSEFDGSMTSSCVPYDKKSCLFTPELPDYSNCSSAWLSEIENLPPEGALDLMMNKVENGSYTGKEISNVMNLVSSTVRRQAAATADKPPAERLSIQENSTVNASVVLNNLVKLSKTWEQLKGEERVNTSTLIFSTVAAVGFVLADLTDETGNCTDYSGDSAEAAENLKFRAYAKNKENLGSLTYGPGDAQISISGYGSEGQSCTKMVSFYLKADNIADLYPVNWNNSQFDAAYSTNSDIIGFSFPPGQPQRRSEDFSAVSVLKSKRPPIYPLQRVVHNPGTGTPTFVLGSQECAYWDEESKVWSSKGCKVDKEKTTATETVCVCSHLTPFAALMAQHTYEGWPVELDITTTVCESLSVVALFFNFILHGLFRLYRGGGRGNSERIAITLNISFWLFFSHLIILLFMNRNQFKISDDACTAVAIILHFSLLSSFGWMLVEGLCAYRMLVIVFKTEKSFKVINFTIGYGIPTLIVAITCITAAASTEGIREGYSSVAQCWLNIENGYVWSFNVPVIIICTANFGVLVLACMKKLRTIEAAVPKKRSSETKVWLIGFPALTFAMGVPWIFGMFTLLPDYWPLYLFGVLNGLQGMFMLIFQSTLNTQVIKGVKQVMYRWWTPRMTLISDFISQATRKKSDNSSSTTRILGNGATPPVSTQQSSSSPSTTEPDAPPYDNPVSMEWLAAECSKLRPISVIVDDGVCDDSCA